MTKKLNILPMTTPTTASIKELCEMAARSILKALDIRDNYTFGHSLRVAKYCLILGKHMNLSLEELYDLELSALFHDIGKIGIPDNVLCKPKSLTAEEFSIMQKHPELSYEILKDFKHFHNVAINARHHHERFDGKGYPHGLVGENIPLCARIILIADTYDAITSSRVYRKGNDPQIAYEELEEFAGTQFDPRLVAIFIEAMHEYNSQEHQEEKTLTIISEKNSKAA
jgi:HD-GYP domain-containing protein (c-di-GMP phosphodiesterase class II)